MKISNYILSNIYKSLFKSVTKSLLFNLPIRAPPLTIDIIALDNRERKKKIERDTDRQKQIYRYIDRENRDRQKESYIYKKKYLIISFQKSLQVTF